MATHSSILAWRMPWTEEPGSHDSRELAHTWHVCTSTYKVLFHFISLGPWKKTLSPLQDSETRCSSRRPSPFPSSPTRTALDCWSASEFYLDPEQIFQFGPHTDFMTDPVCGQETGVLQNAGSRQGLEGIF